ncbi:hypothetical protein SELMODRAFT_228299 [Selaginella moellendorffii]|uniref:Uncharacterized protein n=1 Tax=Selaginella moellendorffii TaxID=88036 RepID=D8RUG5_SELML|nr:uncharacterized protein LOC9636912 [Selaginella moellendorffii]EFJ24405.1 hypothetical protein SELMODRAFT_228299 [Selaginella moellendorffii]|eukprot:XP_002974885.1 uncharacterized protein LOC9636912 [Selaginella moellendorffii]
MEEQGATKQGQFQAPFYVPVVFDPVSGMPMIPLYPAPQDENSRQGGIFAVPAVGSSLPPVPFAYGAPLGIPFGREDPSETTEGAAGQAAAGARPDQQERVIVRRFQVGIHLDLLLILKLITMVFIFSQDGSRDRLLLLFLASIVYLYQTGALTPILRWASERARRIMMPPIQPARNAPVPEARGGDNGAAAVPAAIPPEDLQNEARVAAAPDADEQPARAEDQAQAQDQDQAQAQAQLGNWRGFVREVQMLAVGFVTSLLPGFHNIE